MLKQKSGYPKKTTHRYKKSPKLPNSLAERGVGKGGNEPFPT